MDALCLLLAVTFTGFGVLDGLDRHFDPVPLAIDGAVGGLCCLALLLRRRWPVGVAVAVGLFSVYATTASGVGLIALYAAAVRRRPAVVIPIGAGHVVASVLAPLVRPDIPAPDWSELLLDVVCVAAALAWGMFLRARRQLTAAQRERARRAEAEQELRIAQARQLERDRIAREMHDVLAHRISLLSLHAGALELRPDAPPAEIARAAGVIRDSAHRALEDLREVIGVLRADRAGDPASDVPEPPQPTLVDLPVLVDETRDSGTGVRLDCHVADPAAVPAAIGRTAYRIVQEGLTNVRKHAPGADVSVTVLGTAGQGLTVEVRNSPPAVAATAPAIPGAGTGLVGLTERVNLAGGRLEHGLTAAGGFRLWAWLPWPS